MNSDTERVLGELFKNSEIVEELREGPQDKHELADVLGVSSKTVYRRVGDLVDLRLVERDSDGYRLTNVGRVHAELLEYTQSVSAAIYRANGLLEDVSSNALPPFQVLRDADIVCSEPHVPNKPLHMMESFVSDTKRMSGISPVLLPKYVELFHYETVSEGLDAEFVLTEAVATHLRSEYGDRLDQAVDSGATILETTAEIPFGLLVAEKPSPEVLLLLYGPRSRLNGALRTDHPVGLDWAEETYREFRFDATPLRR